MKKFTDADITKGYCNELLYLRSIDQSDLTKKLLDWQKAGLTYTATGYGSKIPTEWMINFNGRLQRVYVSIHSNSGVCYIKSKGRMIITEIY